MNFESLTALFLAYLVIALKPGPYLFTVSSMAVTGRLKEITALLIGGYTAGTLGFVLVLSGAAYVEGVASFIIILVKAMAAAYFIWLGIEGLMSSNNSNEDEIVKEKKKDILSRTFPRNMLAGFLLSASNPFDIAFVLGVVPSIVDVQEIALADMLIYKSALILCDLMVLGIYITPLYFFHKSFSERTLDRVKTASNIALILIGLYLGYQALPAEELGLL